MTKLVVDNTALDARQRQLEAQVQVAFATAANRMLGFLVGKSEGNMIKAMEEFIAIHNHAAKENIDPAGVAIRVPKLERENNEENEHINAILRGSLKMVAAMLKMYARNPTDRAGDHSPETESNHDYESALLEITEGIEFALRQQASVRPD